MNNLINMSDQEKIIFINGMNENQNTNIADIKELSNNYPFVVFFTNSKFLKYDEDLHIESSYPIANIWKGGIRLTRFVGIDPNNNSIDLGGGHKLQLTYDYETGLVGLYDPNKLISITLEEVSYINLSENEETILGNSVTVNSKDNKFSFKVKFTADGDVSQILNSLYIANDPNNFTILTSSAVGSIKDEGNNLTSIIYKYNCQINKDTFISNNGITYDIYSAYASNIHINPSINLSLILNPLRYNVLYNGVITYQYSIVELPNESDSETFTVYLDPSAVESYSKRKLYVKLAIDNNYVKFVNNEGSQTEQIHEVSGSTTIFNIKPQNESHQSVTTRITFSILYDINDGNGKQTYSYLTESRNLQIGPNPADTYYYAGYDNPDNDTFDINKLIPFNNYNLGINIIWDWKDSNLNDINNPFYIAIPVIYKDIIKPRWDAYTYDRNNNKIYVDCSSWFTIIKQLKTINGINFIIYQKIQNGMFYGKIQ